MPIIDMTPVRAGLAWTHEGVVRFKQTVAPPVPTLWDWFRDTKVGFCLLMCVLVAIAYVVSRFVGEGNELHVFVFMAIALIVAAGVLLKILVVVKIPPWHEVSLLDMHRSHQSYGLDHAWRECIDALRRENARREFVFEFLDEGMLPNRTYVWAEAVYSGPCILWMFEEEPSFEAALGWPRLVKTPILVRGPGGRKVFPQDYA